MPRLQQQSDHEEQLYYYKHHLLPDHENPDTYDGIVRQISFRFLTPANGTSATGSGLTGLGKHASAHGVRIDLSPHSSRGSSSGSGSNHYKNKTLNSPASNDGQTIVSTEPSGELSSDSAGSGLPPVANKTQATPIVMEQGSYSTALSVTIAIGCSLLILNMLIFAGVYYQLDKAKATKNSSNLNGREYSQQNLNQTDGRAGSNQHVRQDHSGHYGQAFQEVSEQSSSEEKKSR